MFKTGSLTVEQAAARIRERDSVLRSFISLRLDEALKESAALSKQPRLSPLHNAPYSLKDVWEITGTRTTAGSFRFRDRVSSTTSPLYEIFSAAGAVLMGKTNCSDLSISPETDNYLAGFASNPHDVSRTAGGSSGGAAAAVADGMSLFDWGTDIGGSIRNPAAYCGVYGMRLSTSTWTRSGDFPTPPESIAFMNGHGPITRDLAMMKIVLNTASKKLRVGAARPFQPKGIALYPVPKSSQGMWPRYADDISKIIGLLGPSKIKTDLPSLGHVKKVYASIWASHFLELAKADPLGLVGGILAALSAILFRGIFGDRRFFPTTATYLVAVALGNLFLFHDKKKALNNGKSIEQALQTAWNEGWILALPTNTYPAPKRGRTLWNLHLLDCILPANIADATALAIPFGTFDNGMPRSLQLLGPPGSEFILLETAEKISNALKPTP